MLSLLQKADVRRHLGFGPVGTNTAASGGSFIGYRFFVTQGLLEYRLNNLSIDEETILLGSGDSEHPANPNYLDPDSQTVVDGYLAICNILEGKIATATDNLDTVRAGEWHARQDEVQARDNLYRYWCTKMAQYLYLPQGKPLGGSPKGMMVN